MEHIRTATDRSRLQPPRRAAWRATALFLAAACDAAEVSDPEDPPAACEGVESPLQSQTCLEALGGHCRSLETASACTNEGTFATIAAETGYEISCAWIPTVSFADAALCNEPEIGGECGVTVRNFTACDQTCPDDPGRWLTDVATGVLVMVPCGRPNGTHEGPLAWPNELTSCGANGADCACVPTACEALSSAAAATAD